MSKKNSISNFWGFADQFGRPFEKEGGTSTFSEPKVKEEKTDKNKNKKTLIFPSWVLVFFPLLADSSFYSKEGLPVLIHHSSVFRCLPLLETVFNFSKFSDEKNRDGYKKSKKVVKGKKDV